MMEAVSSARYYEPTSGRFLSADPMGQAASPSLYDFAGGDPVNFFDPDGRSPNTGNRYPNGLYKPTEVNIANGVNDPGVGGQNPVDPNPGVYNGVATAALDGGTRFLNQLFNDIVNTPQSIADAAGSAAAGIVNLVDSGTRAQTASGIVQDLKALGSLQTWENLGSNLLTPEGLANSVYAIDLGIAGPALGTVSSGTAVAEGGTTAAESPMVTVIGSQTDIAESGLQGVEGYNVLERPAGMSDAEFGRYNAEWMNAALQRGDTIMAVTDPAAHEAMLESIQEDLSLKSNYLNIELPMLEQYGAAVPSQVSVPPVVPFYFTR